MTNLNTDIQVGTPENAEAISALAIQVFLDTYATEGVRPDLAAEAFSEYSKEQFLLRLEEPNRTFLIAKQNDGIIGFAELRIRSLIPPALEVEGAELVRLYIQPKFQRLGIGQELLIEVEQVVLAHKGNLLWFTVWEKNERAICFYGANGYNEIGTTKYEFQGNIYGNKVLSKVLHTADSAA